MILPIPTRQQHCEHIKKDWGYEHVVINFDKYCFKVLALMPGKKSSLHFHRVKDETFFIVYGYCLLEYGKRKRTMYQGCYQRIRPKVQHRFSLPKSFGNNPCIIIEVSTKHDDADVYRIEKSGVCE